MNSFTNYLEKLGSNFLVAAMVPSLALVITSILMFDPILHIAKLFKDVHGAYKLIGFGPIIFISTVIIGFTLTALNTFILKMFEGYVVFPPLQFLYNLSRKIHRTRARKMVADRDDLKLQVLQMQKDYKRDPTLRSKLNKLQEKYYFVTATYDQTYPQSEDDILPTRFGNTLKAAENYSGERYGLDSVNFFPRLVQVIPSDYKASIDATRNELSFLVNMSVLSVVFSMLCIVAFFYVMWTVDIKVGAEGYVLFIDKAARYLIAAAVGFVSGGFFYNASIFSVSSFGLMIRSSFDLFRLDLLKKLGLERPKDYGEEFNTWYSLNELVVLGGHSVHFTDLKYHPEDSNE
jgi:hypothetical protein